MATNSPVHYSKGEHEDAFQTEERKGLLSEHYNEKPEPDTRPNDWSAQKIAATAAILICILLSGAVARTLLLPLPTHPNLLFHGGALRSNGTHDFRRTVLLVSIDGLRWVGLVCIS
jgi:hypothetical protein